MRGDEELQGAFVVLTSLEDVVPDDHPLRAIRTIVDRALHEMKPRLDALYAGHGRPSIAPEYLLRAQLAQILDAISSERRLCEQLRYNLLLRWFVGLADGRTGLASDELHQEPLLLLNGEVAEAFFGQSEPRRSAQAPLPRALLPRRYAPRGGRLTQEPAGHRRGR